MAISAYLKITGAKSGDVKGGCTQRGREDSIVVIAATHQVSSPRDPHTGLPTGQRQHGQFTITKELDKSSPILYNILCTNENIASWELKFWTPQIKATTGVGSEVQHYTVKLTNANIASINFTLPNTKDAARAVEFEDVSFTYQKIEWTWTDGGISADDDWLTRL